MRHRHEAHVVEIERVRSDRVRKRGVGGSGATRGPHDVTLALAADNPARDYSCRFNRAGEDDADGIADGGRGSVPRRRGWLSVDDEIGDDSEDALGGNRHGRRLYVVSAFRRTYRAAYRSSSCRAMMSRCSSLVPPPMTSRGASR